MNLGPRCGAMVSGAGPLNAARRARSPAHPANPSDAMTVRRILNSFGSIQKRKRKREKYASVVSRRGCRCEEEQQGAHLVGKWGIEGWWTRSNRGTFHGVKMEQTRGRSWRFYFDWSHVCVININIKYIHVGVHIIIHLAGLLKYPNSGRQDA